MAREGLTIKQQRFVDAYLGEARGNATQAARLAGYKGNDVTLASVGNENIRKPQIRAAIEERMRNDPLVMSREEMLQRLSLFARGGEVAPADGGLTPAMPRDQLKAMEQLAKLVGWDKPKDDAGDTDLKRLADILEGRNAKETDS